MQPTFDVSQMLFTPQLAREIMESSQYEHQRPIKPHHVKELSEAMKSGRFLSNTIVLCENGDGKRYLTNGQHTLSAIIESGVSLALPVQIIKANDHDEIGQMYGRIDRGARRMISDSLRAHGLQQKLGMTRTDTERFASAARLVMCDFVNSPVRISLVQDDDLVEFMIDWEITAKSYLECVEGPLSTAMRRRDVFSVGLATFRYVPESAQKFWEPVATDDALSVGDPRKTLNKWLANSGIQSGSVARKKRLVNTAEGIRSCAIAWNAWRRGRDLSFIRVLSTTSDFVLQDTPYGKIGREL